MQVAQTILQQLGGNRFAVMTGAKNFLGDESSLSFRLPSYFARGGINAVKVTLNDLDLYDVKLMKVRGTSVATVAESANLYAEDMVRYFSEKTGLALKLF